jgi:fibronectin-binding autotransporter adhesin
MSGFTVSSGVTLAVSAGTVSNTTVLSGGTLELLAGAVQSGTTISSGGILEIGSGETLSGYRASAGITLEAGFGGSLSNTIVLSGGALDVLAGGRANGITVSSGGTAEIADGAIVSGLSSVSATGKSATLLVEGDIITVSTGGVVLGSGAQLELEGGQLSGSLTVAKGATVNALSGADLLLATSGKTITNSGLISVENGATLTLSGTVRNSGGTLFADAGTLDIAGVVSGGSTVIGNGTVDIQQASNENVTFQLGGTGGLELDVASTYTGKVSGFGNGGNTSQYIDLTNIAFNGNVSRSYSGNTTSGVLTVMSGGTVVAKINMVGNYTTSSFKLGMDSSGHHRPAA